MALIRRCRLNVLAVVAAVLAASGAAAANAERGFLGMQVQGMSPKIAAALDREDAAGVLVRDISVDGPASKAGIARGDLIVAVDGVRIDTFERLMQLTKPMPPGTTIAVEVERLGRPMTFEMTLAAWPEPWRVEESSFAAQPDLGLTFAALTPKLRQRMGVAWGTTGILVTVANDAFVGITPLRRGDVVTQINQKPIWEPRQFLDAYATAKAEGRPALLLLVERKEGFTYMLQPIARPKAEAVAPPVFKLPGQAN